MAAMSTTGAPTAASLPNISSLTSSPLHAAPPKDNIHSHASHAPHALHASHDSHASHASHASHDSHASHASPTSHASHAPHSSHSSDVPHGSTPSPPPPATSHSAYATSETESSECSPSDLTKSLSCPTSLIRPRFVVQRSLLNRADTTERTPTSKSDTTTGGNPKYRADSSSGDPQYRADSAGEILEYRAGTTGEMANYRADSSGEMAKYRVDTSGGILESSARCQVLLQSIILGREDAKGGVARRGGVFCRAEDSASDSGEEEQDKGGARIALLHGYSNATEKYGTSNATEKYGTSNTTERYGSSSTTGQCGNSNSTEKCGTETAQKARSEQDNQLPGDVPSGRVEARSARVRPRPRHLLQPPGDWLSVGGSCITAAYHRGEQGTSPRSPLGMPAKAFPGSMSEDLGEEDTVKVVALPSNGRSRASLELPRASHAAMPAVQKRRSLCERPQSVPDRSSSGPIGDHLWGTSQHPPLSVVLAQRTLSKSPLCPATQSEPERRFLETSDAPGRDFCGQSDPANRSHSLVSGKGRAHYSASDSDLRSMVEGFREGPPSTTSFREGSPSVAEGPSRRHEIGMPHIREREGTNSMGQCNRNQESSLLGREQTGALGSSREGSPRQSQGFPSQQEWSQSQRQGSPIQQEWPQSQRQGSPIQMEASRDRRRTESPLDRRMRRSSAAKRDGLSLEETWAKLNSLIVSSPGRSPAGAGPSNRSLLLCPATAAMSLRENQKLGNGGQERPLRMGSEDQRLGIESQERALKLGIGNQERPLRMGSSPLRSSLKQCGSLTGGGQGILQKSASEAARGAVEGQNCSPKRVQFNEVVEVRKFISRSGIELDMSAKLG